MKLTTVQYQFTLLTDCFSGTALGKEAPRAEMRIPPIRGHVRFWHRALFGHENTSWVWGSASGDQGGGSRVGLAFAEGPSDKQADPEAEVLPHKEERNKRGSRPAVAAGESFDLCLQRLVGCGNEDWDHARHAVELWLLVGGLGLRSNRAAGSIWPVGDGAPRNGSDLKNRLRQLGFNQWSVALIGENQDMSPADLRITASDTIRGNRHRHVFGGINPRCPSPTKFKVVRLENGHCLLALAPHGNRRDHGTPGTVLRQAEQRLHQKPQPIRWTRLGPWNHIIP